jgi:DNA modification methylase
MSLGKNQLFYGDNYEVLQKYIKDESVDLVYIDPPFNSKRNYNQIYNNIGNEDKAQAQAFVDTWEWNLRAEKDLKEILTGNNFTPQTIDLIIGLEKVLKKGTLLAYLTSMTLRINEIWRVLKPTGSFYLHCDPTASHYLKLLCDTIFCANRGGLYLNEIIWQRTTAHSDSTTRYGKNNDTLYFYSKSGNYNWNLQYSDLSSKRLANYSYTDNDGRKWASGDLSAKGLTGGGYEYDYKGIKGYWRCPLSKMEQLEKENRLYFTKNGIRIKRYLDENKGHLLQQVWTDISPISSQAKERLGYPTQKPLALLERIIQASSNEGDTVLDAYCGCGTTVHASQKLNRNWVGIDITYQSISLIIKRLEDSFGKESVKININKPPSPLKGEKVISDSSLDNTIQVFGIPKDMEAARALAHKEDDRVRKEFEKWAVLTYSNNRAMINDKKGGDGGIDGISRFPKTSLTDLGTVIFSVKSDKTINPAYIDQLAGTVERNKADMGILICLNEPSKGARQRANEYGTWNNPYNKSDYPKIQIVTIEEVVMQELRIDNVLAGVVLKQAVIDDYKTKQKSILDEEIN